MLTPETKEELLRQQYRLVGEHSAVKICGWTKHMIKGNGGCYKLKFYGIRSNQCLQMTTSMSCANRCTFCWRGYKAPVSREWQGSVDDPAMIVNESLRAHHKLLEGFGGLDIAKQSHTLSKNVKHVALSLTGEPIIYPRINELLEDFNKRGISTFLVTNAQYPQNIKDLAPVTQLYISIDAPNKQMLHEIDNPLFKDYWERFIESLKNMSEKRQRTCIRLTIIKGVNDVEHENYAKLIKIADPDFVEIKAYMHVGASRERLAMSSMPFHEHIQSFTQQIARYLPGYEIVTEHKPSRVILLAKTEYKRQGKWYTWIDFDAWNRIINSGREPLREEYWAPMPSQTDACENGEESGLE